MKKFLFSKIARVLTMVLVAIMCLTFSACNESGEEIHRVPAVPGDTINTNTNATYKVGAEMIDTVTYSGWLKGYAQLRGQGFIETLVSTTGKEDEINRTVFGGRSISNIVLAKDTVFCGTTFTDVTFCVTSVKNEDCTTTDSIGSNVVQQFAVSDGQNGNLNDLCRYLNVVLSSGGTVPHYEGISKIIGVKYEVETDTTRRVYLLVESSTRPKGTTNAPIFDMYYSAWYMQKIRKEVVPPEPEVEKMDWSVVFELKENSVAKTLQATFNFTGTKGTTFSWKSNTGKAGKYSSPENPYFVASTVPLPQDGNGAAFEPSLAKDKTTDKEIVMVTSHERCLLSKWTTDFRTGIGDGDVPLRNDVDFYVTNVEFSFNNGETFRFDFEPETILHDDQFITESGLTQTLTGSDGKTYKYGKTLVQSATHKIRGTVTTPDGKTSTIVIDVLPDGETLLENEGKVALYVMQ